MTKHKKDTISQETLRKLSQRENRQRIKELKKLRGSTTHKIPTPITPSTYINDNQVFQEATNCSYLSLPNGNAAMCQRMGASGRYEMDLGIYDRNDNPITHFTYSTAVGVGNLYNPILVMLQNSRLGIFYSIVRPNTVVVAFRRINLVNPTQEESATGLFTVTTDNPNPQFLVQPLSNGGFLVAFPNGSGNIAFIEYTPTFTLASKAIGTSIPWPNNLQLTTNNANRPTTREVFFYYQQPGSNQPIMQGFLSRSRFNENNLSLGPTSTFLENPQSSITNFHLTTSETTLPSIATNPLLPSTISYLTFYSIQSGTIYSQPIDPNGAKIGLPFEITHPNSNQILDFSRTIDNSGTIIIGLHDDPQSMAIDSMISGATPDLNTETVIYGQLAKLIQNNQGIIELLLIGAQFELPADTIDITPNPYNPNNLLITGPTQNQIRTATIDYDNIPSHTPSPTPSVSFGTSRSPTVSVTPPPSISSSVSPSRSGSPTATGSRTATRTASRTATITNTRTSTITASKSPTTSATSLPSPSSPPSDSESRSLSPTATGTKTSTITASRTPAITNSRTPTVTVTGSLSGSITSSITNSKTPVPTSQLPSPSSPPSLSAESSLSPFLTLTRSVAPVIPSISSSIIPTRALTTTASPVATPSPNSGVYVPPFPPFLLALIFGGLVFGVLYIVQKQQKKEFEEGLFVDEKNKLLSELKELEQGIDTIIAGSGSFERIKEKLSSLIKYYQEGDSISQNTEDLALKILNPVLFAVNRIKYVEDVLQIKAQLSKYIRMVESASTIYVNRSNANEFIAELQIRRFGKSSQKIRQYESDDYENCDIADVLRAYKKGTLFVSLIDIVSDLLLSIHQKTTAEALFQSIHEKTTTDVSLQDAERFKQIWENCRENGKVQNKSDAIFALNFLRRTAQLEDKRVSGSDDMERVKKIVDKIKQSAREKELSFVLLTEPTFINPFGSKYPKIDELVFMDNGEIKFKWKEKEGEEIKTRSVLVDGYDVVLVGNSKDKEDRDVLINNIKKFLRERVLEQRVEDQEPVSIEPLEPLNQEIIPAVRLPENTVITANYYKLKVRQIAEFLKTNQKNLLLYPLVLVDEEDRFCAIADFRIGLNDEISFTYINCEPADALTLGKKKIKFMTIRGDKVFEVLENGDENKVESSVVVDLYDLTAAYQRETIQGSTSQELVRISTDEETEILESSDPYIMQYHAYRVSIAAESEYEGQTGFVDISQFVRCIDSANSLKQKLDKSVTNLHQVAEEVIGGPEITPDQVEAVTNESVDLTELKEYCKQRSIYLEQARESKLGVARKVIRKDNQVPILVRKKREGKDEIIFDSESFEISYLNLIAASADIFEIMVSEDPGYKRVFFNALTEKVEYFAKSIYKDKEILALKGKLEKAKLDNDNKAIKKLAKELQDKYRKKLTQGTNELCNLLKECGIKKPHKALDIAKDYQNYNYENHDVITISEFKVEISGQTIYGPQTVIQAEVGCRGLTEEQKQEYQAILDDSGNLGKPAWFYGLTRLEQGLVRKYADKIIAGNHIRPTQLRNIPGIGNFFQKRIYVVNDSNELEEVFSSFHSGTIANLNSNKSEGYRLCFQNARQCQAIVGNLYKIHPNTLNSPWNLAGNDPKLVKHAKKSTAVAGGFETNTPFNLFRIAGNYELEGVILLLREIASLICLDDVENEEDKKRAKLVKEYIQVDDLFLASFSGNRQKRLASRSLNECNEFNNIEKGILQQAIKLAKAVRSAERLLKLDPFGENISLNLARELDILSYRLNQARQAALSSDTSEENRCFKLSLARLQAIITMCESGKDRTGLSEHDKTCEVLAVRAAEAIISDHPKSSDSYSDREVELIEEETRAQISPQLAKTLHTQNQNGSVLVGGCSNGAYGIKETEGKLYVPYKMRPEVESLMAGSADNNKVKPPKSRKGAMAKKALIATGVVGVAYELPVATAVTAAAVATVCAPTAYRKVTTGRDIKRRRSEVEKILAPRVEAENAALR